MESSRVQARLTCGGWPQLDSRRPGSYSKDMSEYGVSTDWFERLTGFRELSYEQTRRNLEVARATLRSKVNQKSYAIGELETPSLKELRNRGQDALGPLTGKLRVTNVCGDVRRMHHDAANERALFQVASQFNLLEMVGPGVTPEDGVSRYSGDATQGPACAIAAGAATIYRNYFAPTSGQIGQTHDRQIDCLKDLGVALGNHDDSLWKMRNGYALCSEEGLATIDRQLAAQDRQGLDELRQLLRVGIHWDVQVTDAPEPNPVVSQVFCSALPVSYTPVASERWQSFATLILEGAYEATLWAAVLNAGRHGSAVVFLTLLGGGAFGNETSWIHHAMHRALERFEDVALDVRVVSYRKIDSGLERLAQEFG
jgi:hypothetical protein